jgi:dipeptidyl aminopeptidase/acylaminoacyl peptidase
MPVLIGHNRKDNQVQWRQGVELYLALRRLQKPCWLLSYDEGGHGMDGTGVALDFTIRLTQFFDHYLKGTLPTRWMKDGIPGRLKVIELGY